MPAFNEAFVGEQFERVNERLRAIEQQLSLLSEKAGIAYEAPSAQIPQEVIDLKVAGKELEAIKKYRELTGCGGTEARMAVGKI